MKNSIEDWKIVLRKYPWKKSKKTVRENWEIRCKLEDSLSKFIVQIMKAPEWKNKESGWNKISNKIMYDI